MASHTIGTRPPHDAVAPPRLEQDVDSLIRYVEDAAHYPGGSTALVAKPITEGEVAWLLQQHAAVLPIGAQSSLTGGATPFGDVVIAMTNMTGLLGVRDDTVRVQAGVPLAALQQALQERGLFYPPVPTFAGATVGGVLSTNAAGAATVRYGTTRDWVRAITVVLASGEVLDVERGECRASEDRHFDILTDKGVVRIDVPRLTMPDVPKRSAGYFAAPGMDLVDLFIGAEGTLGVVTEATLGLARLPPSRWLALVQVSDDRRALEFVQRIRFLAADRHATAGFAVSAIEHIDRRSLALLSQDGVVDRLNIGILDDTTMALLVELEDDRTLDRSAAWDELTNALDRPSDTSPIGQLCRVLRGFSLLETTEVVMPDDRERREQLLAFREAVPEAVNRRVGRAQRELDPRIQKMAGDFIAPMSRFDEMMAAVRSSFERRDLDYAVWGHISDGNVHPNVIPRSVEDVVAGKAAILEAGSAVIRLGGCPMAEHGVGRNPVKQRLLELLYGRRGVDEMRRVKAALDPGWKLASGVLFARE
ncbi:MAG: FAD-binding oxidoreductase [Vicinamibacterales bacterium]